MSAVSQTIVNNAWNLAHVLAQGIADDLETAWEQSLAIVEKMKE